MRWIVFPIALLWIALQVRAQAPVTYAGKVIASTNTVEVPLTVDNFSDVGAISLKLSYNPTILQFLGTTDEALIDIITGAHAGHIYIAWATDGISPAPSLPNGSLLLNIQFQILNQGTSPLVWVDDDGGISCEYMSFTTLQPFIDTPTATFYVDGWVSMLSVSFTRDYALPSITAVPAGGHTPYTFAWTGPLGQTASTDVIFPIDGYGHYQLLLTDALGAQLMTSYYYGPVHNTTTMLDYPGIQAAVDAAQANQALLLDAYTFYESDILVDKPGLSLSGAGNNLSIINPDPMKLDDHDCSPDGGQDHHGIIIAASQVTISNLGIDGGASYQYRSGITTRYWEPGGPYHQTQLHQISVLRTWFQGIVLRTYNNGISNGNQITSCLVQESGNNCLDDNSWGIFVQDVDLSVVSSCTVNFYYQGIASMNTGGEYASILIQENVVTQVVKKAFALVRTKSTSLFTLNTGLFTDPANTGTGLYASRMQGTASNNTFTGAETGVFLSISNIGLNDNLIHQGGTGIRLEDSSNPLIRDNSISANSAYGLFNNTSILVDASQNWWGHASGPFHPVLNTCGMGNAVNDNVTLCPWYIDAGKDPLSLNGCYILPFDVTGGGAYCAGQSGSAIGLSGSELQVNYQLYLNNTAHGVPLAGTGSSLDFGVQSAAGTYTILASNTLTGCSLLPMNGQVVVSIEALPLTDVISLRYSQDGSSWESLSGDISTGYQLCLDPTTNYILDIETFALATGSPLIRSDVLHPIYLIQTSDNNAYMAYWTARGVDGINNSGGWELQMWDIIQGNAPFFYLKYTPADTALIDGLQYNLMGGSPPLTLPGDYPPLTYTYSYSVQGVNGCNSDPLDIQMVMHQIPVPTLSGPDPVCTGATGTVYLTDAGKSNYQWTVSGGTITAGGGINDNTVTITWGSAGTGILTLHYEEPATACTGGTTLEVTIQNCAVSGTFKYHNNAKTPLNNIIVTLKSGNSVVAIDTTDILGNYTFHGLPAGVYDVYASTSKPTAGAINATDAGMVNSWQVGPPYQIEKIQFLAGDVSRTAPPSYITSFDGFKIREYFVFQGIVPWTPPTEKWSFWKSGENISANPWAEPHVPSITMGPSGLIDGHFYGLVSGDFNRSFIPGNQKGNTGNIHLEEGEIRVASQGSVQTLNFRVTQPIELGAISLILNYPEEMIEIIDISLGPNPTESVLFHADNGQLRIGWFTAHPYELLPGDVLLKLDVKVLDLPGPGAPIAFSAAMDPLNELADGRFVPISQVVLKADALQGTASNIAHHNGKMTRILAYPNPGKDYITLESSRVVTGNICLEIRNAIGQLVHQQNIIDHTHGSQLIHLNIENWHSGLYIAHLISEGQEPIHSAQVKFIKN